MLQLTILIILIQLIKCYRGAAGVYGTAGIYCNPSTNTFYTNGDIVAFAASDRRLKDNITPIPNALDKILKLVVIHLIGMINKMYILVKILVL
jgi:hypothetical protein